MVGLLVAPAHPINPCQNNQVYVRSKIVLFFGGGRPGHNWVVR